MAFRNRRLMLQCVLLPSTWESQCKGSCSELAGLSETEKWEGMVSPRAHWCVWVHFLPHASITLPVGAWRPGPEPPQCPWERVSEPAVTHSPWNGHLLSAQGSQRSIGSRPRLVCLLGGRNQLPSQEGRKKNTYTVGKSWSSSPVNLCAFISYLFKEYAKPGDISAQQCTTLLVPGNKNGWKFTNAFCC